MQPLTFAALTGHKVITSLWDDSGSGEGSYETSSEQNGIEHIAEAQWSDALVVAPATANILAKFAHGIADDFLTTMYLATQAPVLVAPAMNVNMWDHPATQANLEILRQRGVRVIEPGTGDLACGMVGAGRMAEPDAIADAVLNALGRRHDLAGEVVLVTAGGTREALDPVRYHRQPLQRQNGVCPGRCRAKPRSQSHPHQRAYGALSSIALRGGQGHHRRSDAPGRARTHDRRHAGDQGRRGGRLPARQRLRPKAQAHRAPHARTCAH